MKFNFIVILFSSILLGEVMEINATSYDDWIYINLGIPAVVLPNNPEDNLGWDIACQRYHFRTNSGLSGNGNGGAYVDSLNTWNSNLFQELSQVSNESYFETDRIVNNFYEVIDQNGDGVIQDEEHVMYLPGIANPALETWGLIDIDNNYTMNYTDNQFIVRDGTGERFYKLWAIDYYSSGGTSGYITILFDEILPCNEPSGCDEVCGSILEFDECGECGGSGIPDDQCDCNGNVLDLCGICGGDNTVCVDCEGIPNGNAQDLGCGCGEPAATNGYDCEGNYLNLKNVIAGKYELYNNYPNPFNPSTTITYSIQKPSRVSIDIYNINGQKIFNVLDNFQTSENNTVYWNGRNENNQKLPSGTYFYTLSIDGTIMSTKKMILLY